MERTTVLIREVPPRVTESAIRALVNSHLSSDLPDERCEFTCGICYLRLDANETWCVGLSSSEMARSCCLSLQKSQCPWDSSRKLRAGLKSYSAASGETTFYPRTQSVSSSYTLECVDSYMAGALQSQEASPEIFWGTSHANPAGPQPNIVATLPGAINLGQIDLVTLQQHLRLLACQSAPNGALLVSNSQLASLQRTITHYIYEYQDIIIDGVANLSFRSS